MSDGMLRIDNLKIDEHGLGVVRRVRLINSSQPIIIISFHITVITVGQLSHLHLGDKSVIWSTQSSLISPSLLSTVITTSLTPQHSNI